jgi:DNA polymerase-3 subunit alpha
MNKLINWLQDREIVFKINKNILEIENFGKSLIINENSEKVVSSDFSFDLSDSEYDILDKDESIKYIVFNWGNKFYYSELKPKKNELGENVFEPSFNDLTNLGIYKSQFEKYRFVNLGVHTGYELLNGSGEADDWVKRAKFLNHDKIGICEKNTLAGTLPLQLSCKKKGLSCILGQTVSVAHNFDYEKSNQEIFDIKLYVVNYTGWKNLLNISKNINVDFAGFIPEELLLKHSEGLIAVFPIDGYFNFVIKDNLKAEKYIKKYKNHFHGIYYQVDCSEYNDDSLDLKFLNNLKTYFNIFYSKLEPVLISDAYYVNRHDFKLKPILNKIDGKSNASSDEQYYKDVDDIIEKFIPLFEKNSSEFNKVLKAIKNTRLIAESCTYQIDTGNHKLPKFEVEDPEKLYDDLIFKGFKKKVISRGIKNVDVYLDRVKEENDVIKGAGFIHYFLILWDIVDWCKKENILVGPGRGSVGGSLIAYLLDIIEIDPIQYNLLFERFLNKSRVSGERAKQADALPDIDIDFEGKRRHDVKRYIEQKYGIDYVCSVGTYTRMKTKSAIKDFGRAKGIPFQDVNIATRLIPDSHHPDWGDIFKYSLKEKRLKEFVQSNVEICEIIKAPLGQPRSSSIHPSAVLIVPKFDSNGNKMTIYDWIPVKKMDGQLVSEWEGKYIDAAGFLKEDILGIQQLDKFKYILDLIRVNLNKKVSLNKIPINKPNVMEFFKKGLNEDVFQFGTSGLKSYSKKVRPDNIEDLISMNALFRPGPMDSKAHEDFVDIKHGKKKPSFDYKMEEVTKNTFGLYVYQEQIMQAMTVGGLTLVEADQIRTYIKKFDKENLGKFREKFVDGYSKLFKDADGKEEAEKVWNKLMAFSAYGFNRSHSAAYSLMGYWSQYLKVNYPLEFWTASLNFSEEKIEIPNRLSEIEKTSMGIKVKQPDINKSDVNFTSDKNNNSIYWSLTKIKGVGEVAVKNILDEKNINGNFFDLEDFLSRVPKSKVNKRVVQSLIIAGAFDEIGGEDGLEINEKKDRAKILKRHSEIMDVDLPDLLNEKESNSNWFWSVKQKELTGFGFIDFLPLINKTKMNLKKFPYLTAREFEISEFKDGKPWAPQEKGEPACVAGVIQGISEYKTKANGNWRIVITLESNNSFIFLGVFGELWGKLKENYWSALNSKVLICVNGFALSNNYKMKDNSNSNKTLWLNKDSKLITLSNEQ